MGKEKIDTVDFMSFINSMSKLDEMNTPKKKKKSKKKKPLKMSEGGTPTEEEEEKTPGKDIGTAAAEGLMAIGKGMQEAYDGELDPAKFNFSGTSRR